MALRSLARKDPSLCSAQAYTPRNEISPVHFSSSTSSALRYAVGGMLPKHNGTENRERFSKAETGHWDLNPLAYLQRNAAW